MAPSKCLLLFILFLSAFVATHADSLDKVVCYFGSWSVYRQGKGKFSIEDINPKLCTHLIYTFVGLNSDGTIKILDPYLDIDSKGYKRFNALKKSNPSLKTSVAIGGWNEGSEKYSRVVANPSLRGNLVRNAVKFLQEHGFDGFDVDWEYPCQRGGSPKDKGNFVSLLKELRAEFDKYGYILTAAVAAASSSVDISYDVPSVSKYLHFIHVMTYDLHGSWDAKTGENSPLYASSSDTSELQKSLNVNASIHGWIQRGADPGKIVLGLGVYGRTFTLASSSNTGIGAQSYGPGNGGPYTHEAGMLGYNEICELQADGGWTVVWDDEQKVPYAFKDTQWVGYDNPKSISIKVDYANSLNLGGVMIWSIETDDFNGVCGEKYPILNAINKK